MYNRINYLANISYLTNTMIYEYDLSKANINILLTKGLINKKTYDYLYNAERMVRQTYVGNLCKEEKYVRAIQSGIIDAKKLLFESNNIQPYEVLSIKNDAIFIIGRELSNTKFGLYEFKCKHIYTSFYKIKNLEMYYYYNTFNNDESIDIKGISDDKLELHKDYILQFFKDVFYVLQINGVSDAVLLLKDFYNQYITLSLDVNYYRKFDNTCMYHYKYSTFSKAGYNIESILEKDKNNIDITYNLSLLLELQKILQTITFTK